METHLGLIRMVDGRATEAEKDRFQLIEEQHNVGGQLVWSKWHIATYYEEFAHHLRTSSHPNSL